MIGGDAGALQIDYLFRGEEVHPPLTLSSADVPDMHNTDPARLEYSRQVLLNQIIEHSPCHRHTDLIDSTLREIASKKGLRPIALSLEEKAALHGIDCVRVSQGHQYSKEVTLHFSGGHGVTFLYVTDTTLKIDIVLNIDQAETIRDESHRKQINVDIIRQAFSRRKNVSALWAIVDGRSIPLEM